MDDPLGWLPAGLAARAAAGLHRTLRHRSSAGGRAFDGLVNLSSNDYLGLAGDARVVAAAKDAAATWGAGSGASRLVTGGTALHRTLEESIARWKGTEDAVVFSSGYLANTGTIPALVGVRDAVFSDALNHASIVDACRLSRAAVEVYPHRNATALAAALARSTAQRGLIVTDGVFSMDGDTADLPAICDLADAHGAAVMVDDAHGCGVLGPDGRGTAAAQGCDGRVHVQLGTLSKAFGSAGGYVAGSAALCDWLRNTARAFVFDTAPPPAGIGAALRALQLSIDEPWRREHAVALTQRLAAGLRRLGATVPGAAPAACVVPLIVGAAEAALRLSAALEDAGYLAVAIRPPSVPPGSARLRFALTAAHTEQDVDGVLDVLSSILQPATVAHPGSLDPRQPGRRNRLAAVSWWDDAAMPNRDVYTHGHTDAVLRSHRWRTAENSAGYLLPHLRPGLTLLDVGCGPGTLTVDLARRVAPGTVTGVDTAAGVLAEARRHAADADVRSVTFQTGDFRTAGLPARSFDVVHAHQVLQHLRDPVGALRAMAALTRPGGLIAVRDSDYPAFFWFPADERLDRWREVYLAVTHGNGAHADAGRRLPSWALAAGLGDATYSSSTWTFATPAERGWWGRLWAERVVGSALGDQAVEYGIARRDELAEIAAGWRDWAAHPDGVFVVAHGELLALAP